MPDLHDYLGTRTAVCRHHGETEHDVVRCWQCGGEGEMNDYDSDPLWYESEEDAWEPCDICDGDGHYLVCSKCRKGADDA